MTDYDEAVLREVEWEGERLYSEQPPTCPCCECTKRPFHGELGGHSHYCRLAKVLEGES